MSEDAAYWIEKLALVPHPEGGCYRETYRSGGRISGAGPGGGFPENRCFSTAIYYLLRSTEVSTLHRLRSDELFHFYRGSSLEIHVIRPAGEYEKIELGSDAERGEVLQAVVPAGCWFGATVREPRSYSLVGCSVSPGFEFGDFEQADRSRLLGLYPEHRSIIERLTRQAPSPLVRR